MLRDSSVNSDGCTPREEPGEGWQLGRREQGNRPGMHRRWGPVCRSSDDEQSSAVTPEKTRRQMAGRFLTRWNVWNAIKWATPTEAKLILPCSQDKFRSIGLQKVGPRYALVVCVYFYQGVTQSQKLQLHSHTSITFIPRHSYSVSQLLSFRTSIETLK